MNKIRNFINNYHPLSQTEFDVFCSVIKLEEFKKNAFLIREREQCNHLYFVQEGAARAFFLKDGKEVTTWFAFDNQVLTSYYSFITREYSLENIQTLQDTILYSIHYDDLQKLYTEFHGIESLGRKITEFYYKW